MRSDWVGLELVQIIAGEIDFSPAGNTLQTHVLMRKYLAVVKKDFVEMLKKSADFMPMLKDVARDKGLQFDWSTIQEHCGWNNMVHTALESRLEAVSKGTAPTRKASAIDDQGKSHDVYTFQVYASAGTTLTYPLALVRVLSWLKVQLSEEPRSLPCATADIETTRTHSCMDADGKVQELAVVVINGDYEDIPAVVRFNATGDIHNENVIFTWKQVIFAMENCTITGIDPMKQVIFHNDTGDSPNTPNCLMLWQSYNTPLIGLKLQVNPGLPIAGSWLECDVHMEAVQFKTIVQLLLEQGSSPRHTMIVCLSLRQVSVLFHSEICIRDRVVN